MKTIQFPYEHDNLIPPNTLNRIWIVPVLYENKFKTVSEVILMKKKKDQFYFLPGVVLIS